MISCHVDLLLHVVVLVASALDCRTVVLVALQTHVFILQGHKDLPSLETMLQLCEYERIKFNAGVAWKSYKN